MRFLLPAVLLSFTGCAVGPNYKRPAVQHPPAYRGASATPAASLGDEKWVNLFGDEKLQELIRVALVENYDVRMAAKRVLEARAIVTATRSALFPQVDGQATATRQVGAGAGINQRRLAGSVAWDLDLWGRMRRANESARADLLAQEFVQQGVFQTLIADIATHYFVLRDLDQQLEISSNALESRKASLRLVEARLQGGVGSKLDVDQASSLVAQAEVTITNLKLSIAQTENLLSTLAGRNPGEVIRGAPLAAQKVWVEVPAGLPSSLLERRPDIRQAEQNLISRNARVGEAKAAFFPSLALTGSGGVQRFEVGELFSSSGSLRAFGAQLDLPIFDAGRRVGNYRAAQARQQQATFAYQKAILDAFRDVSDSLAGHQAARERRAKQEGLTITLRDQLRLSNLRYRGGVTSYLEVLDSERQSFSAELALSQSIRDELASVVQLYRALGGGWNP